MADILIQMEMPKTCGECRFCRPKPPYPCNCYAGDFLIKPSETDMRDGLCPLVELPEHGALVDRDEIIEQIAETPFTMSMFQTVKECRAAIDAKEVIHNVVANADAVIPSNKERSVNK